MEAPSGDPLMESIDLIVLGIGIIALALARHLGGIQSELEKIRKLLEKK